MLPYDIDDLAQPELQFDNNGIMGVYNRPEMGYCYISWIFVFPNLLCRL